MPVRFVQDEYVSVSEEGDLDVCISISPNNFVYERVVTFFVVIEEGATASKS